MKTLITRIKRLALALCFVTPLVSWAANSPTATVDGTSVTISNESGAESWDNATLSPLSSFQNKTFTVPEIGTDVPAGTILKVSSVSFAKSTSMTGYPAKIKIAGCVSAAATVTSGGFTTAGADKITYSFGDGICLLKAGTASQIAFLDANGVQVTSGGSFAFRVGYNAYQFIGSVVWGGKAPIIEIEAEIVDGYVNFEASSGNGWGFQSGSGSGKVYVSGYKNYMLTPGTNEKEIVLTDGTYGYAFDIKDANSMASNTPNQLTDWAKISGDGTLTTATANSARTPVLLLRDTSDFTGTINATASCKLTTVLCGTTETFEDNAIYNKVFLNYCGAFYVTSERSTSNSNVVTIPAGKTWTGTALLNEGETVIDGTFAGPVVNSGVLTVNGTVTGEIANSGSGTVTVNAGATISSFVSVRDFTGFTVDSSVTAAVTMTSEEYGKGSISIAGATGISSITVLAPDGTTTLGTITPDTTGAGELALASVNVSGLACWYDWEMNGNLDGSGVNTGALTYDSGSAANNFYNSAMLYTYRHPYTSVTFPETWTAVVRCTVPKVVNGTVITFGTRYTSFIGLIAGDDPETEMKLVRYNSGDQAYSVLASIPIVDGTSAQHVYIFSVENNSAVKVYCDGSVVLDQTFDAFSLGGGIQIGSAHGGVAGGLVRMWAGDTYDGFTTSDLEEARVDCVRLYDYSLSAEQVAALAAEFPAVKLYRATVEADASTTWGALSWSPSWDGGNSRSKVILTAEGDATVTLPATITAEEVQFVIPAESTVALTGPGTLAVTEPVDVSGGTLSLSGTLTLDEDLVISGSVVFDGVTTDGTGGLKLANGATVGATEAIVVAPLGTYTCAEGTVADAAYTDDGVKLIPLTSAVVSITQGETTLYYSDLDTAVGLLVNDPGSISDDVVVTLLNGTTWPTTPVDYAGMLRLYGYYIDDNGILTKAVARILTTMYPTLAAAVGAAGDGATVGLLRASSEEITLNDKAITLSETANFSGTLTGNGTLTFAAFRNNPSITFDNWTGTVVLPSFAADGTKLNKYGVAGSTVVLKGITGGWFGETSAQKMDVAPVLQLDGNVTIKGFSASWDYTFAELAGTGNFVLDPTDNSPQSATITKVADDFTGIITNNTTVTLTIGTLARQAGTSTEPGTLLLSTGGTGDVAVEAVTIGGEPADVYLVYEDDGVYVGVPPVEINPSDVVINYNSYATLSVVGGSLEGATYGWTMYTNGVACSSTSGPVKISSGKKTATVKVYSETTAFDNVVAKVAITNGEEVIEREATITVADVAAKIGDTEYGKAELDDAIAAAIASGDVLEHYVSVSTTISKGQTLKTKKLAERNGSASVKAAASSTAGEAWTIAKTEEDGVITWSVETETPIFEFTSEDGETVEYLASPKNAAGVNKLLSDATITKQFSVTKDGVVLDLNGHALTSTYASTSAGAVYVNVISPAPAALTVKDSVGGGSIAAASAHSVFMLGNNGQLTVEGGSFTGKHIVYGSKTTSVATITGGTFTATDAGFTLNMLDSARGTITVTGGTFTGFNPANNAAEGAGTNFVPTGYVSTETSTGVWTVTAKPSGINPEDPTSTQEVAVETEGKTQEQIEAEAIAAASVTVPEAAKTVVEESTYKTYFNYTVTETATPGVYEVAVDQTKDLKEEVVLPEAVTVGEETISQAEEVLEAVTTDATNATVPAVAGIYYSLVAADNLNFTEAVEGAQTLATGATVTIAKPTQLPSGDAVFFRVKASATPNNN